MNQPPPPASSIELDVRRESLRFAVAGARTSVPLLWLVVALMLLPAPGLGLGWLVGLVGGMALASGLWRLGFMWRLPAVATMESAQLDAAERQIQANAALSGLMWATATLVMYPALPPIQATLHFLVQLGSMAMAAFYMSLVRRSFEWIALPMALPLIGLSALHPRLASWPLALGTALFLLAMWRATTHFRATTRLAIRRGLEAAAASQLLRESRDRAEAEAAAKTRFLATMSHEVRTPLSGALGALNLLAGERLPAAQQELLDTARDATLALQASLDEVLIYTKVEAGLLEWQPEPLSLAELIADALEKPAAEAARKNLALNSTLSPGLPSHVVADRSWLRTVLRSLLSNGVKFTERGRVSLQVGPDPARPGAIRFEVRDTGIGMSAQGQARLFQPFQQLDDGPQRAYAGAGLGLALSQRLVQLMGGLITVQSRPGQGSRFEFSLVLAPASGPELPAAPDAPDAEPAPMSGTVLVAEDNPSNRLVAVRVLRAAGLTVLEAHDGEDALRAMHQGGLAMVLMDCQMPVLDGYAATRQWREHERRLGKARLPIVALTASALPQDQALARDSGMDDLVAKPYVPRVLLATVSRWLPRPVAAAAQ